MMIHQRGGTPYPFAIRARVMFLLSKGYSSRNIAKRLCISRGTVLRYKKLAQDQNVTVPKPRKMGGYRKSKLNRSQIQWLSEHLVKNPKLLFLHYGMFYTIKLECITVEHHIEIPKPQRI
mmetsp:Transcript_1566/g.2039  ORF Transcript_1566/g.2039 Transcript_1566/m.2039 type:complete len:120 (+) Transcript_1566:158-517(+)